MLKKLDDGGRECRRRENEELDVQGVENDARALLLTNARHGFHNRARYWRGDGDASNCFSKEIAGIVLSA